MPLNDIIRHLQVFDCATLQKRPGEILVKGGDFAHEIILIKSGTLRFEHPGIRYAKGHDRAFQRKFLGLKEAFLEKPFNYSVIVSEALHYIPYPRENVFQLIKENPYFRLKLMNLIAREIRDTNPHFE